MVLERTRPSRPAECTLRRIRATSGCGASSSSISRVVGIIIHGAPSSVGRSATVNTGRSRPRRGEPPATQVRHEIRNSSLQAADPPHQLARGPLGLGDLAFQLAAPVGVHGRRLRLALEAADQLAQVLLNRFDVVLEAGERSLDLLDRPVLRHHPLDHVHAPDDVRRVEPARAAVLALAADAHRARQQPQLHVLAQRRLREANPARLEDVDDLARRQSVGPRALDLVELAILQQPAQRRRRARAVVGVSAGTRAKEAGRFIIGY